MRQLLAANQAALLGSVIMPRDFIEIAAKNRTTGAIVYERLWSDIFSVSAQVVDPITGNTVTRAFTGAGGLVEGDGGIPMVSNLTVQETSLIFSAYGTDVDRIFRLYDVKGAQIIIWRGFLDTGTRLMVAPAETIFIGEIDDVELPVGADGSEEFARVTCLSSQELTRSNPDTRSDASQKRRDATDDFFKYAAAVPDWTMWWGQKKSPIPAETSGSPPPKAPGVSAGDRGGDGFSYSGGRHS